MAAEAKLAAGTTVTAAMSPLVEAAIIGLAMRMAAAAWRSSQPAAAVVMEGAAVVTSLAAAAMVL